MAVICPTITASDISQYQEQLNRVKDFASRVHIDLMDGHLTPTKSVDISDVSLPEGLIADIHVMFLKPLDIIDQLIALKPHMVIIHAEAEVGHQAFAELLHDNNVKACLALLPDTKIVDIESKVNSFDQLLIFGGNFGYQGGQAKLELINKVRQAKQTYPDKELAWDGGINDQNVKALVDAGAQVLNVGAFIQSSPDPKSAYDKLSSSLN